ncbi:MAG TPA: glycoside hydrolase family 99-like domain-containing protein [Ktedonobacteraceae bacterium]|nr:glycoside hydrolase family 99-like domain-containing protein [Ktedonobacteraceae bacterium]
MNVFRHGRQLKVTAACACICLLVLLSACGNAGSAGKQGQATGSPATRSTEGVQQKSTTTPIQVPPQNSTPTPKPTTGAISPNIQPGGNNPNRPVLAFYYMWYDTSSWCLCQMSDLPTIQYNSSDTATIARQVNQAANAGLSGFISSWWGPGSATDTNFAKLLDYSATLQQQTGYHFTSTIYFESDAPQLNNVTNMVNGLNYVIAHYGNSPYFFHWHGKPVIFFWDPLGGGRTLATWATIRKQVDPNNTMIWSAEGADTSVLSVFDGIHLFSAGYWGIQHNDMATVDQGFRAKIDAYNSANHTQKIWAAGVLPGYNDTRVPGRTGTYIVARNNGATYSESWQAAIASNPDWITITSFNEWFEGSMLEPSVTYGNLYLDQTATFTRQW